MKPWFDSNEWWMRLVFRVAALALMAYASHLLYELYRYRGEPDIEGISRAVDQIQRDVQKLREHTEPETPYVVPPPKLPDSWGAPPLRPPSAR